MNRCRTSIWFRLLTALMVLSFVPEGTPLALGIGDIKGVQMLDIGDIKGAPSAPVMRTASRRLRRISNRRIAYVGTYRKKVTERVNTVHQKLASSPPVKVQVLQNVKLAFVDERDQPVRDLRVALSVNTKKGSRIVESVTDAQGIVTIKGVSPLPAAIDISLKAEATTSDGEPEWELSRPEMASILIQKSTGTRVADYAPGREPYHVASTATVAQNSRTRTYAFQMNQKVTLRRNIVDFVMDLPDGAQVTIPTASSGEEGSSSLETAVSYRRDGSSTRFTLPTSLFTKGAVPLRLTKNTDGATFEAVLSDYNHDPYAGPNRIGQDIKMKLVSVKNLRVAKDVGVLATAGDIRRALGETHGRKATAKVEKMADGSEWWKYDRQGVWLRVRHGEIFGSAFKDGIVERVRLVSTLGGSIAGISPGDDVSRVTSQLGEPERTEEDRLAYMDGGVVFDTTGGKVSAIDVVRPADLLENGTTAFTPRAPMKLFVESFTPDSRCCIQSSADLTRYLRQVGVVKLVDNKEDADYVMSASTSFEERKDDVLGNLIPLKYEATTRLKYSLTDNVTGKIIASEDTVVGNSKADYTKQVSGAAATLAIIEIALGKTNDDLRHIVEVGIAATMIHRLKESMNRAVARCPKISEQAAFNQLSDKLYDCADFTARVTDVDYRKGLVTLNVGTEDGVTASSSAGQPTVFELLLGKDAKCPSEETGLNADFYAARVVSATERSCQAEMIHIKRRITKSREEKHIEPAATAVCQIPDPATGVVSGRVRVRFLELLPTDPESLGDASSDRSQGG